MGTKKTKKGKETSGINRDREAEHPHVKDLDPFPYPYIIENDQLKMG